MPYHVGEKGSYGCSGYPAVKDDGEVMGCHDTREEAAAQIYAINQSEGNIDKRYSVREEVPGCDGFAVVDEDGELESCHATREEAEAAARMENQDEMNDDDMDNDMMDKAAPTGTITDPMPASSAPKTTIKEPKMKAKKKKGGVGGDSAGAVVATSSGMSTKSEFAGFARDVTKASRLTQVFKDK